jgi:YrbI family 3-deoxy-D-manno-octulosonate 8-phosphate phosphatase
VDIDLVELFVFDFDGVLTNNKVIIGNEPGQEFVECNRADGLGFDALKKLSIKSYILSSEKNSVVQSRGDKLQVPVLHGITDKAASLTNLSKELSVSFDKIFYIGNDINDLNAIDCCGFSACPADSHRSVKQSVDFVLKSHGGEGVLREILEDIFQLNLHKILY